MEERTQKTSPTNVQAQPLPSQSALTVLDQVLVLTVRKGFWASPAAKIFPHRIYTRQLMRVSGRLGSSRNPLNNLSVLVEGYLYYRRRRPKVILIGSANRAAPWFAALKRAGLLPGVQLIATTQSYLTDRDVAQCARVIIFNRKETSLRDPAVQSKYVFIPLPADGNFEGLEAIPQADYIFSGGGAGRDFATLIEAVRGTDVPLRIVTFSPQTLGYSEALPANCTVEWRMPPHAFLQRVAAARFVVVPLIRGEHPHGHTTVVQALRLGKPVITTHNASCDDYIRDGEEGLLVEPGDVEGYRAAIEQLQTDQILFAHCQQKADAMAQELTHERFAQAVTALCREVMQADE